MGKGKSNLTDSVRSKKNDLGGSGSACSAEQVAGFPTLHIFFYWMLFGQLIILLLRIFDYSGLRPVIDWVSSVVPPVDSIRYSVKVMDNDLARAHHALMWLFSPFLIIAMLFSPVRQGEKEWFLRTSSPFKMAFIIFLVLLMTAFIFYSEFPSSPRQTLGLERFTIGFAFVSSFYSSFIALPFRCVKLILTDIMEYL
ncbi:MULTISPECIES: hypothetical protein [Pseudomonadota]|nr:MULTISPECIES: hypothetical protein [Pseudomonadota]QTW17775.1 hypothetical protein H8N02_10955 [Comamonas kerstersii]